MASDLKYILSELAEDLPGFVAGAVVLVEDGLTLAEHTVDPEVEAGEAAAYLASIVKSNRKAIRLLAGGQITDDILITTDQNYFLIRHGASQPFFIFIMTTKNEWLGRARVMMRRYEKIINAIMVGKTKLPAADRQLQPA